MMTQPMSHADSKADKRRGESRKQKAKGKREKGKGKMWEEGTHI